MEPGLPVALAAAATVGAAMLLPLTTDQRVAVAGVALLVCAWACRADKPAHIRALVAAALVAGAADAWFAQQRDVPPSAARTARYACTVLGALGDDSSRASFECGLDDGPTVLVNAPGEPPPDGTRILVRAMLEPFDGARNPDEPAESDLQHERGVAARLAKAQILRTLPARDSVNAVIARLRGWALQQLRARIPEPQASLIAGELWGERAALPSDVRDEFAQTGTVHVLVTAGLHLGAVAALALLLLRTVRAPRTLSCVVAIGCAWSYALLAGAHTPSLRAAAMLTVALAARAAGRKALSWNAFGWAGLLLVLLRPLDVSGASFLLSFSCVAAILAWVPPLDDALRARAALPARLREAIAVAVATQIGTWPLTAAIFLQFAPYAVAANVCVVPVVGATMLLAGAQLALTWSPPLEQCCANLAAWGATWMLAVVHGLASLPEARIAMTPAPPWCIGAYDLAVLGAPWSWRRGRRTLVFAAIAVAVALVLLPPRAPDRRLRITVLDVGQADAIVIQTPDGHALLVDAGGQLERGAQSPAQSSAERVGERIVLPYLLRHGIHALDAIVLSHPHGDHAGGVAPVLRLLRVDELADSGQQYPGHAYNDAIAVARRDRVPVVLPRAGETWRTADGLALRFIGPSLPFLEHTGNDINDNSIAFMLEYRDFRMLFTGDAGTAAEQRFLNEGIDLHADVLKVGHHGSAYGSTPAFIAAVHPRYAIVSVGRHNVFGHPAPSTIATLRRFGARIYRTDQDGAVTIATDGESETVSEMVPSPARE